MLVQYKVHIYKKKKKKTDKENKKGKAESGKHKKAIVIEYLLNLDWSNLDHKSVKDKAQGDKIPDFVLQGKSW